MLFYISARFLSFRLWCWFSTAFMPLIYTLWLGLSTVSTGFFSKLWTTLLLFALHRVRLFLNFCAFFRLWFFASEHVKLPCHALESVLCYAKIQSSFSIFNFLSILYDFFVLEIGSYSFVLPFRVFFVSVFFHDDQSYFLYSGCFSVFCCLCSGQRRGVGKNRTTNCSNMHTFIGGTHGIIYFSSCHPCCLLLVCSNTYRI